LQLSVIGAVTLALVVLLVAFNFVLRQRLSEEADNALFARASAELASLRVVGEQVTAPEVVDAGAVDAQTWVFARGRTLEQPRSDAVTQGSAETLATGPRRTMNVPRTHTRLYAVPVRVAGQRVGTVVAEVSLSPYEKTEQTALIASTVLGAVMLILVAIAARVLISGALRPVARMTEQAAAWSELDSGERFELGPPNDELTRLGATLDRLLDRVANSLRREQRFSAELSHELRTPLTNVIAEAQLALRHGRTPEQYRAGYERVLASAQQMARTLETLVSAARAELQKPHGTGDAVAAARAAADGCTSLAARRGVELNVRGAGGSVGVGADTDVVERVLAPLIENACRHGRSSVSVAVERRNGAVEIIVSDDGPGVAERDRERIFEPGWRGGDASSGQGAGLGLSLARRLARAAGGDVVVEACTRGGVFTARLPAG
jgi:two-component system, OmpR family, sensor kinase